MSTERGTFMHGLFSELYDQFERYNNLVGEMSQLEARVMIAERNLRLTREHLQVKLNDTEETVSRSLRKTLDQTRFVGARLGTACTEIIREKKKLTIQEMLRELNAGKFRFRTSAPLREVNAAMLRQPNITKQGDFWIYEQSEQKQKWGAKP